MAPHFDENFCPITTGTPFFHPSLASDFPHIAHAFSLYAQPWHRTFPCSVFAVHFLHELEYEAYGFLAFLPRSLLFETPALPSTAEEEEEEEVLFLFDDEEALPAPEPDAGEP